MDQDAFRSLLGAPAPKSGTGRAAGVLGTYAPKRGAGASSSKPEKLSLRKEESKPAFAPRKVKTDGKYKDRAAMRREGREDEYKPVERLLEDFERRAKDADQDQDQIEEERKYLGGDAEHSILVKGLDFGLLAARKAELAVQDSSKYDDELDHLLESGTKSDIQDEMPKAEGSRSKRSRDEIMAELKNKRSKVEGSQVPAPVESVLPPNKFRKITAPPPTEPKKKKKKKRVVAQEPAAQEPVPPSNEPTASTHAPPIDSPPKAPKDPVQTPQSSGPPDVESKAPSIKGDAEQASPENEKPETPPEPQPTPIESHPAEPIPKSPKMEDDDEDDIFGGVGEYSLHISDEDSDSDEETRTKPSKPKQVKREKSAEPVIRAKPGKSWFADDEPQQEDGGGSSVLADILKKTAKDAHSDEAQRLARSRSGSPEDDGAPMRLQPLATSALPSAKELLAMDQEAEKLAKKRANKAKWRAAQGLPAQANNDDDDDYDDDGKRRWDKGDEGKEKQRLNRETQKLQSFMAKKAAH